MYFLCYGDFGIHVTYFGMCFLQVALGTVLDQLLRMLVRIPPEMGTLEILLRPDTWLRQENLCLGGQLGLYIKTLSLKIPKMAR